MPDLGWCSRCPVVGRVGNERGRRDRESHSYCKRCRAEYARDRNKGQKALKGLVPNLLAYLDYLDTFLVRGQVDAAMTMSVNIRNKLMELVTEANVHKSPIPPATLEEMEAHYGTLPDDTAEQVAYGRAIRKLYPRWNPAEYRLRVNGSDDDWITEDEIEAVMRDINTNRD